MSNTSAVERSAPVLKRILVATDFSAAARLAVWRAGQLAKQNDAHLFVVHAPPDWNLVAGSVPAGVEHYQAVARHAEPALTEELSFLETTFGIHARGESRIGRASEVLRSAVADIQPHLIVAGARGEHHAADVAPFLGGTALKLIAYANSPVLVVRKPGATSYSVAVAAVECAGVMARKLVAWATSLLSEGDCHVIHAFDVPYVERMRMYGVTEAAIQSCSQDIRTVAKSFIDDVMDDSTALGTRLHAHLVRGEAVAAILAEIDRLKPEVVVVGKHEHSAREHLTSSLGSVAMRIAYHVPGDVLVVP